MTLGTLLNEAKPKWKKLGDQYTIEKDGDVVGMIMKQARGFNDQRASYEVQAIGDIPFKKFDKIADAKKYIMVYFNSLTESGSKKLLSDLQTAWNKYRFNQDQENVSQAKAFRKKALKLWSAVKKMDSEARNASGRLWKDVIDGDISDGSGRKPKIVKMSKDEISALNKSLLGEDIEDDYAQEIASGTGLRKTFVKSFMTDNNIGGYDFLGVLASKKMSPSDVATAMMGNPNNSYQKKLFKLLAKSK